MAGISSLIVTSIGALTLFYTAYYVTRFLTFHLISPSHPLRSYKRASPEPTYALITGSSAGIGFGVAQALVKEGFAIILLGHLPDELSEAKVTLQKLRRDAVVRTIVMDARTATGEEMATVVQSIANLPVTILVNNIGGIPIKLPAFRVLATYSTEDVDAIINMNSRFMARLTSLM
jgi:17beta-estradiol 17-dehydrogenase / very-long-chain 3-oxoacyl-CoA reductase